MRKEFVEYVSDMISFYRKHRRFIIKVLGIYAAVYAALLAYGHWYHEMHEFFQRLKMKIFGKKEELTSGGLDYEATEDEEEESKEEDDSNPIIASF